MYAFLWYSKYLNGSGFLWQQRGASELRVSPQSTSSRRPRGRGRGRHASATYIRVSGCSCPDYHESLSCLCSYFSLCDMFIVFCVPSFVKHTMPAIRTAARCEVPQEGRTARLKQPRLMTADSFLTPLSPAGHCCPDGIICLVQRVALMRAHVCI